MCKGQCHEIFDFRIFHVSVSPKPLSIPLMPFQFFLQNSLKYSELKKHNGDRWHWGQVYHRCHWYQWRIASGVIDTGVIDTSGELPLVSLTSAANLLRYHWHWWQIFNDGCKFFFKFTNPQTLGLNLQSQICKCNTCRKFANITNFVSPPICGFAIWGTYLRTANLQIFKFATGVVDTCVKFATGVVDTDGKFPIGVVDTSGVPWISPCRIFFKIWNDPNLIFRGVEKEDSWKKPEAKNLMTLSL